MADPWAAPFKTVDGLTLQPEIPFEEAGLVYAGPANGAPAKPTFRKILASDLPSGTPLFGGFVPNGAIYANGTDSLASSGSGLAMQVFTANAPGTAPSFQFINLENNGVAGTLQVEKGGTGASVVGANKFFAGPLGGYDGPPSFRAITDYDLPPVLAQDIVGTIQVSQGGTGVAQAEPNTFFAGPSDPGNGSPPGFRPMVQNDLPDIPLDTSEKLVGILPGTKGGIGVDTSFIEAGAFFVGPKDDAILFGTDPGPPTFRKMDLGDVEHLATPIALKIDETGCNFIVYNIDSYRSANKVATTMNALGTLAIARTMDIEAASEIAKKIPSPACNSIILEATVATVDTLIGRLSLVALDKLATSFGQSGSDIIGNKLGIPVTQGILNRSGAEGAASIVQNMTIATADAIGQKISSTGANEIVGKITTLGANNILGKTTANANYIFAGPSIGSAGSGSFRRLVLEDLPALIPTSQGGTGKSTVDANYFFAGAPFVSGGAPTFRKIVAEDLPSPLPVSIGGTGRSSVGQATFFAGPFIGAGAPFFRSIVTDDLPSTDTLLSKATLVGADYIAYKITVDGANKIIDISSIGIRLTRIDEEIETLRLQQTELVTQVQTVSGVATTANSLAGTANSLAGTANTTAIAAASAAGVADAAAAAAAGIASGAASAAVGAAATAATATGLAAAAQATADSALIAAGIAGGAAAVNTAYGVVVAANFVDIYGQLGYQTGSGHIMKNNRATANNWLKLTSQSPGAEAPYFEISTDQPGFDSRVVLKNWNFDGSRITTAVMGVGGTEGSGNYKNQFFMTAPSLYLDMPFQQTTGNISAGNRSIGNPLSPLTLNYNGTVDNGITEAYKGIDVTNINTQGTTSIRLNNDAGISAIFGVGGSQNAFVPYRSCAFIEAPNLFLNVPYFQISGNISVGNNSLAAPLSPIQINYTGPTRTYQPPTPPQTNTAPPPHYFEDTHSIDITNHNTYGTASMVLKNDNGFMFEVGIGGSLHDNAPYRNTPYIRTSGGLLFDTPVSFIAPIAVSQGGTGVSSVGAGAVLIGPAGSSGPPQWRRITRADISGLDTYIAYGVIYALPDNTLAAVNPLPATLGLPLVSSGNNAAPTFTTISILTGTTGILTTLRGGTGVTTSTGSGNNVLSASPTFTGTIAAQVLTLTTPLATASGGTGVTTSTGSGNIVLSASPTFTGTIVAQVLTLTTPLATASGGTGTITSTGTGSNVLSISPTFTGTVAGQILTLTTPLAATSGGTGVTTSTGTGSNVLSDSPAFTGTVAMQALTLSTPLSVANGGTGSTTTTGSGSTVMSASPTFTGTLNAELGIFKTSSSANYALEARSSASTGNTLRVYGTSTVEQTSIIVENSTGGILNIGQSGATNNYAAGPSQSYIIPSANGLKIIGALKGTGLIQGVDAAFSNTVVVTYSGTTIPYYSKSTNAGAYNSIIFENDTAGVRAEFGIGGSTVSSAAMRGVAYIGGVALQINCPVRITTPLEVLYGGTGSTTSTGTGNNVLSASPTLTGTVVAGALTLQTPLAVSSGGSGQTSVAQNTVFIGPPSGSGAPTWRTLTNADVAGVTSFSPSGTPTTGTGNTVLSNNPTIVTPTVTGGIVINQGTTGTALLVNATPTTANSGDTISIVNLSNQGSPAYKVTNDVGQTSYFGMTGSGNALPNTTFISPASGGLVINGTTKLTGAFTATTGAFSSALTGTTATFTGLLTGVNANLSGALNAASVALTGGITATTGAFSSALTGTTATFTGLLTGVNANLSGALNAASVALTGGITATTAGFSGLLTGAAATFSGLLTVVNATFTGVINAVTVNLTGALSISSGGARPLTILSNSNGDPVTIKNTLAAGQACIAMSDDTVSTGLYVGVGNSTNGLYPKQSYILTTGSNGLKMPQNTSIGPSAANNPDRALWICANNNDNATRLTQYNSGGYASIQFQNNANVNMFMGVGGSAVGGNYQNRMYFTGCDTIADNLWMFNQQPIQNAFMHTVINNWQSNGGAYQLSSGQYVNYPLGTQGAYYFGPSGTVNNYGNLAPNAVVAGNGTTPYWLMPVNGLYFVKWRWTPSPYYNGAAISKNMGQGYEFNSDQLGNVNLLAREAGYYYAGNDQSPPAGLELCATFYANTSDRIYFGQYEGDYIQNTQQPTWNLTFTLLQRTG